MWKTMKVTYWCSFDEFFTFPLTRARGFSLLISLTNYLVVIFNREAQTLHILFVLSVVGANNKRGVSFYDIM